MKMCKLNNSAICMAISRCDLILVLLVTFWELGVTYNLWNIRNKFLDFISK